MKNRILNIFSPPSPHLLFFFLLIFAAISYSNSLYSPFVLDDFHSFIDEPKLYLHDFSPESLAGLAHTFFGKARLVPLATFALDHQLSKGNIVQYHLTNITIHLLACLALLFFLKGLLKTEIGAKVLTFFSPVYFILAVCSLWSLSPVQTNAITYVVQRMTSLAALFYLTSLAFYIHARITPVRIKRYSYFAGALIAAGCAFLSKENSFTLPVVILLVESMFITPGMLGRMIRGARWYYWVMVCIVIVLVLPLFSQPWQSFVGGFGGRHFSLTERLMTELRVVVFYISLLALPLPSRMNLDHDFSVSVSLLSPVSTLTSLLFLAALLVTAFCLRRKAPLVSFGIFWFFLNLVIESSVVPLELVFEHRLYLPSVGFFIALLAACDWILTRLLAPANADARKVVFLTFIILASLSSLLTTLRNNDWRDSVSIYGDAYEKSPLKPRAASNYAMVLGWVGRYDEAIAIAEKAISLGRKNYEEYINAGSNMLACYYLQGKYEEAILRGERLLKEMPPVVNGIGYVKLRFNLGRAYQKGGRYADALKSYIKGLELDPTADFVYVNIAKLFRDAKDDEQAQNELQWNGKEEEVFQRLADISLKLRQYNRAKTYIDMALEIDPANEITLGYQRRYEKIVAQNRLCAEKDNIENDLTYQKNFRFRLLMKTADFILRRYPPLAGRPVGWLLGQAEKTAPTDPFVPVYLIRWYRHNNDLDGAMRIVRNYLPENQDVIPLLEVTGEVYRKQKQDDKAMQVFRHILSLYPGHRRWKQYLTFAA